VEDFCGSVFFSGNIRKQTNIDCFFSIPDDLITKILKIFFLPANVLFRNKYQIGHMTLCDLENV